jgi:hypothetical protein
VLWLVYWKWSSGWVEKGLVWVLKWWMRGNRCPLLLSLCYAGKSPRISFWSNSTAEFKI